MKDVNSCLAKISFAFFFPFIFFLYLETINYEFSFDDIHLVKNNRMLKDPVDFKKIFTSDYWSGTGVSGGEEEKEEKAKGNTYRPVSILLLALNYKLTADNVAVYRIINIALHCIASFLIYILVIKLSKNTTVALITFLLFAFHPVQTETVVPAFGRSETIKTIFSCLAILTAIKADGSKKYLHAVFLFIFTLLAMFTKENAVVILPVIILIEFIFKSEGNLFSFLKSFRSLLIRIIPVLTAIVIYFCARIAVLGSFLNKEEISFVDNPLITASTYERIITSIYIIFRYLFLCFCPFEQSVDYSFAEITPVVSIFDARFLLSFSIIIAFIVLSVLLLKRQRIISFGILTFFLSIIPGSNLIIISSTIMAERLLYQPSMGIFLLFAALFVAVKEKIKMIFPHFLPVFGILLIIIYAAHTYLRISDWSSQCHLAGITAESSKNCARAHLVNGYCLTTAGKIEEGIDEFNETIRIYPKYVDGHIQLANSYEMTEKPDLAEKTYKNLLSIKENSKKGLYHFAMFLIRNRDFKSAKEILEKADKLYPWDNEIKNKLSLVNDLLNSQYNNLLNEF